MYLRACFDDEPVGLLVRRDTVCPHVVHHQHHQVTSFTNCEAVQEAVVVAEGRREQVAVRCVAYACTWGLDVTGRGVRALNAVPDLALNVGEYRRIKELGGLVALARATVAHIANA